jgi:hypothetical protein
MVYFQVQLVCHGTNTAHQLLAGFEPTKALSSLRTICWLEFPRVGKEDKTNLRENDTIRACLRKSRYFISDIYMFRRIQVNRSE